MTYELFFEKIKLLTFPNQNILALVLTNNS